MEGVKCATTLTRFFIQQLSAWVFEGSEDFEMLESDLKGVDRVFVGYAVARGVENIVVASNDKTDDL